MNAGPKEAVSAGGGFTPGPWSVGFSDGTGQTYITAGDHPALKRPEESIAVVVAGCEDSWGIPQGVRNPADARLIAAAPELLRELAHLVALLEPMERDGSLNVPGLATLNGARAAIAKAVQP